MTAQTDPLFIVETSDGQLCGERNWSKQDVFSAILTEEYGRVKRVIEIRLDEHRSADITEDCARELADQFYSNREPVSYETQNWLQTHLGVRITHSLNTAA